jgi:hypothetical protein
MMSFFSFFEHSGDGFIAAVIPTEIIDHEQHKVGPSHGGLGLGTHVRP